MQARKRVIWAILWQMMKIRHGLHIALLEVRRETVHILVIRQNRFSFRTKEIVVPDANQRQQDRQVFLGRRGGEMLVHRVCARKQFNEVINKVELEGKYVPHFKPGKELRDRANIYG